MNDNRLAFKLVDQLERPLRDLRISVTDRCNFRCSYCMPRAVFGQNYPYLPRPDILSFEEIARVGQVFSTLGVRKIRLTGGEPLLRKNLEQLISQLSLLPNVETALTTNASLLAKKAYALKEAGLNRLTVSLDALDNATFQLMSDADFDVEDVLQGIEEAYRVGFENIKVNCVIKRGVNDHALEDLTRYFKGTAITVRFIEYMDVGSTNNWHAKEVVPAKEMKETIERMFPLKDGEQSYPGEVAKSYRYEDDSGKVGFITSVTQPFCGDCTRIRLSTDGKLYSCLFATTGFDLRQQLRSGASDQALSTMIIALWQKRSDRYSELRQIASGEKKKIEMSYIGG
ncbi:MAG: GTP 3',8-cyclase MoaA [Ferrovum sp. 37-45-19]|nr:MAG: GTP 3',8-cyclase MoaA [Ferrovum sp. 21-44-67]OYV94130.1 MAG: GTP 3',8-cyclase MoaA [Ferrovum sp. 37-45-19]OZB34306.1 MAG: GTP 3',8-cyclase MoaA [Ferrovum sp. 34-44-207]HQT81396.1 GTP 3',8-cyclase MoaA [Ferrovaceae bacterium]HQU06283.1 GTP 3',8-cyclase MoaA [Ferrovaceae bacterium]